MAKQTGIHQIRGKVGEHSYYRQSGVNAGLMRGINPAMSERVKNGDEYANTRLNNAEFRNAAELASAMGGIIQPKYRPMILPFSQSKLTKNYLSLIKESTGEWGQRNAVLSQQSRIADHLNDLAKIRFADMFADVEPIVVPLGEITVDVELGWSADQANTLLSMGVTGVVMKITPVRLLVGEYDPLTRKNRVTSASLGTSVQIGEDVTPGEASELSLSITPGLAIVPGYVGMLFAIVVALPYRTVGSVDYTLQEKCTYKCVPVTRAV